MSIFSSIVYYILYFDTFVAMVIAESVQESAGFIRILCANQEYYLCGALYRPDVGEHRTARES